MSKEIDVTYNKFTSFGTRSCKVKDKKKLIYTGIPIIDDPLAGILQNDFIVIGSGTGYGKTQLVINIAKNISENINKSVLFFSLESYIGEVEDRINFNEIKKIWYKEKKDYIDFKKWYCGQYESEYFKNIERKAYAGISKNIKKNLLIRYKEEPEYNVEKFIEDIDLVNVFKDIGFIIVDHLHYFSFPESESENRAIKKVINKLRDTALLLNVPIILVSHLRKLDKKSKTIVPMIEDFHGSSEITKNPTAVLTINPAFDIELDKKYCFPTYFYFAKNRFDGTVSKYILLGSYNIKTGTYDDSYKVYSLLKGGYEIEEVKERPAWAINANITGHFERSYKK